MSAIKDVLKPPTSAAGWLLPGTPVHAKDNKKRRKRKEAARTMNKPTVPAQTPLTGGASLTDDEAMG